MIGLLNGVLGGAALLWLLSSGVLFVECLSAVFLRQPISSITDSLPTTSFRILVPAHNEALVIGTTLSSLLAQVPDPSHIMVIADNCTDNTAEIARQYQVTVLERFDTNRRGKGFALEFGRQALLENPPELVIFIDADCILSQGAIAALITEAQTKQKPIQSLYLLEKPQKVSPKSAISALAFLVKNQVRPAGLAALGLPCLLTGAGMALPWSILQTMSLATDHLVEDMQWGLDLAIAGYPPQFCEQARVTSFLPAQEQVAANQRTRWEHGYIQTLLQEFPKLFKAGFQQRRLDLLALAAEISIVPLSLWVLLWLIGTGISLVADWLGASSIPLCLFGLSGMAFAIAIISAWIKFGRDTISAKTLLSIPFYIIWKIPLYFAFLINRQSRWVRTERDIS